MMNRFRIGSFLTGLVLTLGPIYGWTHHGWAGYDRDVDTSFVIAEVNLGNPHDALVATDSEGRNWDLVLATPNRNRRLGFDENSLSVGDEVNLLGRGHPSRNEIKVHCIYRAGEMVYEYYDFDGTTSLSKHGEQEYC